MAETHLTRATTQLFDNMFYSNVGKQQRNQLRWVPLIKWQTKQLNFGLEVRQNAGYFVDAQFLSIILKCWIFLIRIDDGVETMNHKAFWSFASSRKR